MREIDRLKEEILKDYPKMSEKDSFSFACHQGVPCFNDCCADVNIFLTPYDIIRLKKRLGMSSQEFLKKYTLMPLDKNLKYPAMLLEMTDNEKKSCPFVDKDGCSVYEDRPWACRMYPLGLGSPKEDADQPKGDFYFMLREAVCKGFAEPKTQTVGEWLTDQGIIDYNEMGEYFKNLTLHHFFDSDRTLTPQQIEMFFTVCYDIDSFHDFIFGSSFFEKFDVDQETRERIKDDDVELLKFGYKWLHFALFGEKTITIKSDVRADKEKELKMKKKLK